MQIEWLDTDGGQALQEQECRLAQSVLERVFGDQLVQIGLWGEPGLLLAAARTQTTLIFAATRDTAAGVQVCASPESLPILTDSVDAVLLPHSLELSAEPHSVLREVHRILRPSGKLIVLGFNPLSWWGLRHQVSLTGFPAGILRHISVHRLRDWLTLLNMQVDVVHPCYLRPPANRLARFWQRTGWGANAYLLLATKETMPLTIVRPRLRRRPALVGSLVNTSTRDIA